ncbi:MAG: ATP-binding protein, partial [Actinomycetota bacterium]
RAGGVPSGHPPPTAFLVVPLRHGASFNGMFGLAIVRLAVAQHGGEIELDSTPGEGSVFTVRLPCADAG